MYNIGDKIVYGTIGVMEIADISEQSITDEPVKYYILKEYGASSSSLTYVPVDNALLTSQMRRLYTPDEIKSIIDRAGHEPLLEWNQDNRARSMEYKRILSSGDYVKMLAMIATIEDTGKKREADGKKNYLTDEAIMKKAQKLIASEFALSLGIAEDDVFPYIASH